ncbi:aldo/keto reductase [Planctomicrobium sp. SH664]|uniref:aldo/keto reductase n=1 Tax=Planctomicrobium sp. SH664 TaxID=3448125 RepID=UPI003F5CACEE
MNLQSISRRDAIKAGMLASLVWGKSLAAMAAEKSALPEILKAIPSTGEKLPVIGLGTNAYGAKTEDEKVPLREVLEQMSTAGGKLIDTARAYGKSEEVIGELLGNLGNRKSYFIASKTPIQGDFSNPEEVLDVSFKALRTDVIDLMQIHQLGGVEKMMPALENAKKGGRIRYVGMSTSSDDQYPRMLEAMKTYPLDFIQVDYSLENRNAAEEMLEVAQERKLAVLINMPFGGRRQAASTFSKVANRPLPEWAADFDANSWAQFFLKYVVSHPAVTVAIPGTTKLKHMLDNQGAGRGRLPDAAMRQKIEKYWDTLS